MKHLGLVVAVLLLSAGVALAGPYSAHDVGKLASGKFYDLTVNEVAYQKNNQLAGADYGWWGLDGGEPDYVLGELEIKIDGKKLLLPQRFYADISQINGHKLYEKNGHVVLQLHGGDAAGAYTATFKFNRARMIERVVAHGENPDEIWEKTVFYQEFWDKNY